MSRFCIAVVSLICLGSANAQQNDWGGRPRLLTHHPPSSYGAYPQNWAITFDLNGQVYVGNRDGILQFDGEMWRKIVTEKGTTVRALETDESGRIYVGAQGEIGYLEVDSRGAAKYVSLLSSLREDGNTFSDVWNVASTKDGVFFQSRNRMFLWDGVSMRQWESQSGYHTSFVLARKFYVRERNRGLLAYSESDFSLVPDGELFADIRISAILPYDEQVSTIVTRENGFFRMYADSIDAIETEAGSFSTRHPLYGGCLLRSGQYTFATLGSGVLVTDLDGRILDKIDKRRGLPDDVVNYVAEDDQGGVWAALNNDGLVRIDLISPVVRFGAYEGLEGTIYDIHSEEELIVAATGVGVFGMRRGEGRFSRINGIPRAWSLTSFREGVLIASDEGLYSIHGSGQKELVSDGQFFTVARSATNKELFLTGTKEGIIVYRRKGLSFSEFAQSDLGMEVRSIIEDDSDAIWLGTRTNGVKILRFGGPGLTNPSISDVTMGWTNPEARLSLHDVGTRIVVASSDGGSAEYDRSGAEVENTVSLFGRSNRDTILAVAQDKRGVAWRVLPRTVVQGWYDGKIRFTEDIEALKDGPSYQARIFVEDSGIAWISRDDELLRYDPHVVKNYDVPYHAFVRGVSDLRTDSLLFGGNFRNATGGFGVEQLPDHIPSFDYDHNNLRFVFAAPTFNSPEQTRYQYQLIGADKDWSSWSNKTTASYSSLNEGSYDFRVRAQNGFGYLSEVGSYRFHLLPPWYRTWWAFAVYALGGFLLFTFSWKYARMVKSHRKAEQQARELARERVINERLKEAYEQLQVANERLQEAATLKDEFLATTSHELRTPITAILGYASILREEIPGEYHEFIEIIEKSGERLMHTLNALLDLAKLRAGTMEITPENVDMVDALLEVVNQQQPRAVERGISLDYNKPGQPILVETDRAAVSKVVDLIIDNAIKFTERGGISVSVASGSNYVRISVADTGVGIDDEFLPVLFDEFRQESGGLSRTHSGNGLGLAITAKLVHLLGGTVHVNSRKGKGSTFVIKLPISIAEPLTESGVKQRTTYGPDRNAMTRRRGDIQGQARQPGITETGRTRK